MKKVSSHCFTQTLLRSEFDRTTWSVVERSAADTVVLTTCPRRNDCRHWNNWLPSCGVMSFHFSTRTAAAQSEQRATDADTVVLGVRGEGVVDTRLLGKPKSFDGATDNWRQFKFTFLGYAGLVDSRLKQAMIEPEVLQELAITNPALSESQRSCITCWYSSWRDQRNACWNMQAMVKGC